jgi:hypothetical protein
MRLIALMTLRSDWSESQRLDSFCKGVKPLCGTFRLGAIRVKTAVLQSTRANRCTSGHRFRPNMPGRCHCRICHACEG